MAALRHESCWLIAAKPLNAVMPPCFPNYTLMLVLLPTTYDCPQPRMRGFWIRDLRFSETA